MTAKATKAPPMQTVTKARRSALARKAAEELDLIRWTPEEVVEKQLLPYRSVRSLKEKCYRREVFHHTDGGRITFTPDDIRREHDRGQVAPAA
ncbi:hypothetical protein OG432_24725 [Streptomyces sp. NBC_00442]|uniref:hypothetical protein n=1 Tax=Streptomyces sp. NBC_00442 TaxID=2903651 RepID=UPI002E1C19F1